MRRVTGGVFRSRIVWTLALALALGAASAAFPPCALAAVTCTFTTVDVPFGTYNVLSATRTKSTGAVKGSCSASDPVTIELSPGNSGTTTQRYLLSGSVALDYNLYQDSAYATIWGEGSAAKSATFTTTQKTVTIYGKIPIGQDVSAGSYSDTIVATITY